MPKRITFEEELSREAVASELERLAHKFRNGEVTLELDDQITSFSLSSEVTYEIHVRKSSTVFGGERESIRIELDWK